MAKVFPQVERATDVQWHDESPEVSWAYRTMIKNLGTNPQNMAALLQAIYPELEVAVAGDNVVLRRPGEEKYKVLDSSDVTWSDVSDLPADVLASIVETIAIVLGGTGGAVAGGPAGGAWGGIKAGAASAAGINALRQALAGTVTEAYYKGERAEIDPYEVGASGVLGGLSTLLFGTGISKHQAGKVAKKQLKALADKVEDSGLLKGKRGKKITPSQEKFIKNEVSPILKKVDPAFGGRAWRQDWKRLKSLLSQKGDTENYVAQNAGQRRLLRMQQKDVLHGQAGWASQTGKGIARTAGKALTGKTTEQLRLMQDQIPDEAFSFFSLTKERDTALRRAAEKASRLVNQTRVKAEQYKKKLGKRVTSRKKKFLTSRKESVSGERLEELYKPLIERRKELKERLDITPTQGERDLLEAGIKELDDIMQSSIGRDALVVRGDFKFGAIYDDLTGFTGREGKVFKNPKDLMEEIKELKKIVQSFKSRRGDIIAPSEYLEMLSDAREDIIRGVPLRGNATDLQKQIRVIAEDPTRYKRQIKLLATERLFAQREGLDRMGLSQLSEKLDSMAKNASDTFSRVKGRGDNIRFPLTGEQLNKFKIKVKQAKQKLEDIDRKRRAWKQQAEASYNNKLERARLKGKTIDKEIQGAEIKSADALEMSKRYNALREAQDKLSSYRYERSKKRSLDALQEQINMLRAKGQMTDQMDARLRELNQSKSTSDFLNKMIDLTEDLNQMAHDSGLLDKRIATAEKKFDLYSLRRELGKKFGDDKKAAEQALRWANNQIKLMKQRQALEGQISAKISSLEKSLRLRGGPGDPKPRKVKDVFQKSTFLNTKRLYNENIKELEAKIAMAKRAKDNQRLSKLMQDKAELVEDFRVQEGMINEIGQLKKGIRDFEENKGLKQGAAYLRGLHAKKTQHNLEIGRIEEDFRRNWTTAKRDHKANRSRAYDALREDESVVYTDTFQRQSRREVRAGGDDILLFQQQLTPQQLLNAYENLSRLSKWNVDISKLPKGSVERKNLAMIRRAFAKVQKEILESGEDGRKLVESSRIFSEQKPGLEAVIDTLESKNITLGDKVRMMADSVDKKAEPSSNFEQGVDFLQRQEVDKMVESLEPQVRKRGVKKGPYEPLDVSQEIQDIDMDLSIGKARPLSDDSGGATGRSALVQTGQALGGPKGGAFGALLGFATEDAPLFFLKKQRGYSDLMRDPLGKYVTSPDRALLTGMKIGDEAVLPGDRSAETIDVNQYYPEYFKQNPWDNKEEE